MKKALFSLLAMVGLILVSCNNADETAALLGQEQTVSMKFELPDSFGASTRAANYVNSDKGSITNLNGESITFYLDIYYGSNTTPFFSESATVAVTASTTAEFNPTLVIGEDYDIVAWAQYGSANGSIDLTAIEVGAAINDESVDAFYYSDTQTASPVMSALLTRPFGKLRLVAEDYQTMFEQIGKTVTDVEVEYQSGRYTTFNAKTGEFSTDGATTNFTATLKTYVADAGATQALFVDYIPVNETGAVMYPFTITVTYDDGNTVERIFSQDIPIKRNTLTTLTGNFFTIESEFTLIIDEGFDNEENIDYPDLQYVLDNGGYYKLTESLSLTEPLVISGTTVIINLNGYDIISDNTDAAIRVKNGGTLTINGDGNVDGGSGGDNVAVWAENGGTVIINGGTYIVGPDANGYGNSTIYTTGGDIIINGGHFSTDSSYKGLYYVLNQNNGNPGTITVTGGTFENYNPADGDDNLGGSFVAPGYTSIQISSTPLTYQVILELEEPTAGQYKITNAEGLAAFAILVNNGNDFTGKTVNLGANIDLTGYDWIPIGTNTNTFKGIFDGQSYVISNITVNQADPDMPVGLFGVLNGGTLKNFTVENAHISNNTTGSNGIAIVVGKIFPNGLVDGVQVVDAEVTGNHYMGGIAGYIYGSVTNCSVENATLTAIPDDLAGAGFDNGDKVGGIVGYAGEGNYIIDGNTVNNLFITGYRDLGGIVGCSQTISSISNNTVGTGTITIDQITNSYGPKDKNANEFIGRDLTLGGTTISNNNSSSTITINL